MNIHEYQAKEIFKKFDILVPYGAVLFKANEIKNVLKKFRSTSLVIKAQIHAGGRGKGGGIKVVNSHTQLVDEVKKMLGKNLITHQTGPEGKKVKKYILRKFAIFQKNFICLV